MEGILSCLKKATKQNPQQSVKNLNGQKNYKTKSARKKLTGAFYSESRAVGVFRQKAGEDFDILLISTDDRAILLSSSYIEEKATKKSIGNTNSLLRVF